MKIIQKFSLIAQMGGSLAFTLAFSLVNVESAQAIIQVENLSESNGSSGWTINPSNIVGSSFTTDNDSYTLNSITASLSELTEGDIFINLYTDNVGQPGTIIEQLSTSANLSGGFSDYLFTPSSTVNLNTNTTYWLIGSTTSGTYSWANTNSFNQTGAWTIGDGIAFSSNAGISWSSNNSQPVQFSVDATSASAAVPFEFSPAMGLLLVGGLFGGKAAYGKYRASKVKL